MPERDTLANYADFTMRGLSLYKGIQQKTALPNQIRQAGITARQPRMLLIRA
jgi:hypothetical protein